MKVSIEFFGKQRIVAKTDSLYMPISEKTKVKDVLEYVRHHYPDLTLDEETTLITVNQKMASLDKILSNNDIVSFLPFISGG